jgi:hypothetical protein
MSEEFKAPYYPWVNADLNPKEKLAEEYVEKELEDKEPQPDKYPSHRSTGVMACPICAHPLMGRKEACGLECQHGHKWLLVNEQLQQVKNITEYLEEAIKPTEEALDKHCKELDQHLETNPPHYTVHSIEPIDAVESWNLSFHLGNVIKYIARANWKHNKLQDLKKAQWYLNREIERLEHE